MTLKIEKYLSGALKAKDEAIGGLKEGKWFGFREDGSLQQEAHYKNGSKCGVFITYHLNGCLESQTEYKSGIADGLFKEFYVDGKLKEEGTFKAGDYTPLNFWDEEGSQLLINGSGKKIEKFGYLQGDIYEHYYENGKFIREVKIAEVKFGKFYPNLEDQS